MTALELQSSAGRLVAWHDPPEGDPPEAGPLAAVVCHPHPQRGGTLDNKVVFTLAKTLRERGLHVVRFNFRGVGGSEGTFDGGRAEVDDVRAALDHAAQLVDAGPGGLLLGGFSFGSWVALKVLPDDARVGALLVVAPPVNHYEYPDLGTIEPPICVIYGSEDELVPSSVVDLWLKSGGQTVSSTKVSGASHLFHARLGPLRQAVVGYLDRLVTRGKSASGG